MDVVMPKLRLLHYLVSHSHGEFVAHCLDIDTVATAQNQEEAIESLNALVKAHIEHALRHNPGNLTPAPPVYWKSFTQAEFGGFGTIEISITGPQIVPTPEAHLDVLAAKAA